MESKVYEVNVQIPAWTVVQRVAFRFCFLFFGMTSLTFSNIFLLLLNSNRDASLYFLIKPITFLENHIFHIGYKPEMGSTELVSSLFGWLLLFLILILSVLGTLIWSIASKRKKNYYQLNFWFSNYLAYYLCIVMIGNYAISKMIPTQMPYPDIGTLLTPVGDFSKFNLTWIFVGASPAYERFTGFCELIASLLILFRRTRVFGCLAMTLVLINVVSLNVYYNIIVKLPSIILLLTTLFLLSPYIPKLISFFWFLKPVSLKEKQYKFNTRWKKYLIVALLLAPLWVSYKTIKENINFEHYLTSIRNSQKLYYVRSFTNNDTISSAFNDTISWKRFAITGAYQNMAVVYDIKDKTGIFNFNFDSTNHLLTLTNPVDTSNKYLFNYSYTKNGMALTGNWKNKAVKIDLDNVDINSFVLIKDKTQWMYTAGITP